MPIPSTPTNTVLCIFHLIFSNPAVTALLGAIAAGTFSLFGVLLTIKHQNNLAQQQLKEKRRLELKASIESLYQKLYELFNGYADFYDKAGFLVTSQETLIATFLSFPKKYEASFSMEALNNSWFTQECKEFEEARQGCPIKIFVKAISAKFHYRRDWS